MADLTYLLSKLDTIKEKLQKALNISIGRRIGLGSYGMAFKLPNNKVLKITLDELETKNNIRMQRLHLKHFVEVYRVFQFKSLPRIYFNIIEKVQPLNEDQVELMKTFYWRVLYFKQNYKKIKETFKAKAEELSPEVQTKFEEIYKRLSPLSRGFLSLSPLSSETINNVIKEPEFINQLTESLDEFRKRNLKDLDLHAGNMGWDPDGVLKFFDFGYHSHVPGEAHDIEVVEANINSM